MFELFTKTKEVTLSQFEEIWKRGGSLSRGSQFSNCDKSDYLLVIDKDAETLRRQKEEEMEYLLDSIPTHSMMGVGRHPDSPEDEKLLQAKRDEIYSIEPIVTNVTDMFDAGWVSSALKATGPRALKKELSSLPKNWEECHLVYNQYPTFKRVLVARNNNDGTVQLFRA